MKKALVIALMFGLGLGLTVFAAGPLSGKWTAGISFDPSKLLASDFISFSSTLEIDYTIAGFTFTSTTGFSADGYDAQSFTADGVVGAFTFSSTMNFLPMAIAGTTKTLFYGGSVYNCAFPFPSAWGGLPADLTLSAAALLNELLDPVKTAATPEFDDWTVEGSVSIAGMKFEALFFMEDWAGTSTTIVTPVYEYERKTFVGPPPNIPNLATDLLFATNVQPGFYMPQTGSYTVTTPASTLTGAGWRFKASGSLGDVTLTSYTYFNLIEGFDMDADPDTKSFGRDGEFTIAVADQVVRFTEEYITLEGMSLGCVTFDAALRVTCTDGFDYLALWFKDIYLMCCGITADFEIDFGVASKTVELFPTITTDWTCIEPTIELDLSGDKSIINGFKLTKLAVEVPFNGVTFSSETIFDSASYGKVDSGGTEDTYVLVPSILFNVGRYALATGTVVTAPGNKLVRGDYPVIPPVLVPAWPIPTPIVDTNGMGIYEVQKISFANDYYETFEDFTIKVEADSCCGGAYEISLQTWFGTHYTETLAEFGYWYETNAAAIPGGVVVGTGMNHGQGLFWDVLGSYGAAGWYTYNNGVSPWIPRNGNVPTAAVDVAYQTLIGTGNVPITYNILNVTETTVSGATTLKTAVGGRLFGWAKSSVAAKLGVGSNFTLTGGFTIDAYGWDSVDFGFEFTF